MGLNVRAMAWAPVIASILFAICLKASSTAIGDAVGALFLGLVATLLFVRWSRDRKRGDEADPFPWMAISMTIVSLVLLINSLCH